jgi:hypothetical protein
MIDPLSDFGFNSVWSLTTLVVADGLCPVMGYSTLVPDYGLEACKVETPIPVKISSCSCLETRSPLTKNIIQRKQN